MGAIRTPQVSVQSVGGFLMGYGRGGDRAQPSVLALAGRADRALDPDRTGPGGRWAFVTTGRRRKEGGPGTEGRDPARGSSQKKTKDESTRTLPLTELNEPSQRLVNAVLQNAALYRRLPTIRTQVDHRFYRFFADHPDVAVSLWRAIGVSKLEMPPDRRV